MFATLATRRLEEASREALRAGALSVAAMIDLHLAGTFSVRGETAPTLAAAARCEEASRRFGLSSLPMSLALQAVAHGIAGNRPAMENAVAAVHEIEGDRDTAQMIALANGVALYHLGNGQLFEAIDAMDCAMELLGAVVGGPHDFPGRWALMRTVADDGGEQAREKCRALEFDTVMSRATLRAADAVATGREGETPRRSSPAPTRHSATSRAASFGAWPGCSSHPAPTETAGGNRRHGSERRWPPSRDSTLSTSPASAG